MKNVYIMEACSLIAVMHNEEGANIVYNILKEAANGLLKVYMNNINLLEVYYDVYRRHDKIKADKELESIKATAIIIKTELSEEVFCEAGRLKSTYKISLADAVVLAETLILQGQVITADHHEFDIIEKQEDIKFKWIR